MALFLEEQLEQFQALLKPLDTRLSDINKQQGHLWATSVRQSVQHQFGHSFSKDFIIASLQHLAELICCSVGWPFGSDAVDIFCVSEKLASWLLEHDSADCLLQSVFEALVNSTDGKVTFTEVGQQLKEGPWFDDAGNLDKAALGRSMPAFDGEERKHIKSKLQKVHRLVSQEDQKGIDWGNSMQPTGLYEGARLIQSVCSGQVSHLLTCHSAGGSAGAIRCRASQVPPGTSNFLQGFYAQSAFPSAANDVRGKITMINNRVTIEVGEIKRSWGNQTKPEAVQRGQAPTSAEIKAVAVGDGCRCGPTP